MCEILSATPRGIICRKCITCQLQTEPTTIHCRNSKHRSAQLHAVLLWTASLDISEKCFTMNLQYIKRTQICHQSKLINCRYNGIHVEIKGDKNGVFRFQLFSHLGWELRSGIIHRIYRIVECDHNYKPHCPVSLGWDGLKLLTNHLVVLWTLSLAFPRYVCLNLCPDECHAGRYKANAGETFLHNNGSEISALHRITRHLCSQRNIRLPVKL